MSIVTSPPTGGPVVSAELEAKIAEATARELVGMTADVIASLGMIADALSKSPDLS